MSVSNRADPAGLRVLAVDDEPHILELLSASLGFVGYEVRTASNAREALSQAASFAPEVVLLDVMLPDMDGFEVCRRLRADGIDVPVLFITARDSVASRVGGLEIGGDDYITKPFSLEEVVARIRAVVRRTRHDSTSERLRYADLEMDEAAHLVWRQGTLIELSPTEFKLLRYLLLNPNRVLSKTQILDHVWQYQFGPDTTVVETFISYLRKKIDCFDPPLIHTKRGVGYVLRLPPR